METEYNTETEMTKDEEESFEYAKQNYEVNGFSRYIGEIRSEEGARIGRAMKWDNDNEFQGVEFWIVKEA